MKNNLSIKVNRVSTAEEIHILESLKVDYIGLHVDNDVCFNIDDNPFWNDDRYLMEDQIPELFSTIRYAKGFVECSNDSISAEFISQLAENQVKYIQLENKLALNADIINLCNKAGIQIIYNQHYIVPEDDPTFGTVVKTEWPLLSHFELQVFPSETDAWSFLKKTAPEISEDVITLNDIQALASQYPLFLSLNATKENIVDIFQTLGNIPVAGMSFTLSPSRIGSYHTYNFEDLVAILETIHLMQK